MYTDSRSNCWWLVTVTSVFSSCRSCVETISFVESALQRRGHRFLIMDQALVGCTALWVQEFGACTLQILWSARCETHVALPCFTWRILKDSRTWSDDAPITHRVWKPTTSSRCQQDLIWITLNYYSRLGPTRPGDHGTDVTQHFLGSPNEDVDIMFSTNFH